jgi:uncharacterized spore protein YtfJ
MTDEVEFTYNKPVMADADPSLIVAGETLEKFLAVADVDMAFGQSIRKADTTIIPTAEVFSIMGFGVGGGTSTRENGEKVNGGGGGGGGGESFSRPVAIIVAGPDGVEVKPVIDTTKILLAAFTMFGFMFSTLVRMRRGR